MCVCVCVGGATTWGDALVSALGADESRRKGELRCFSVWCTHLQVTCKRKMHRIFYLCVLLQKCL